MHTQKLRQHIKRRSLADSNTFIFHRTISPQLTISHRAGAPSHCVSFFSLQAHMGYVESFDLDGVDIATTVTDSPDVINDHLFSFLAPTNDHRTKVIGFDAEWFLSEEFVSKCATVHLCDGRSCLIIQLNNVKSFFHRSSSASLLNSLLNFLRLPNYTFVGVGIKDNLVKLEKHYGISCRNAVELGPTAASVNNRPRLSFCGVDELAYAVCLGPDLRPHRPLSVAYNWGDYNLSKELAKLATINVYSYYNIGSRLLGNIPLSVQKIGLLDDYYD